MVGSMAQRPVGGASSVGQLSVGVLGGLQVEVGGRSVPIGGPRPRALLAILVAAGGRPLPGDRLAWEMYDGREPRDPSATVRVHVANLRSAFRRAGLPTDIIATRPGGYVLPLAPDESDAGRFETSRRLAREEEDHERAVGLLDDALSLCRGEPYQGLAELPTVRPEAVRLAAMVRGARLERVEHLLRLGRHRAAVADLESLVADSLADEELHTLLMLALYRSGRQTEALRRAADLRRHLRHEHGLEPGRRMSDLEQAILQQDPVLDWVSDGRVGAGPFPVDPSGLQLRGGEDLADHAAIGALLPSARSWLATAAVIGRPFTIAEADAIGAPNPPMPVATETEHVSVSAAEAVMLATRAQILAEVPGEGSQRFWFVDDHVARLVYEGLDAFTRALLHARAATVIEHESATGGRDRAAELANHGEQALASGRVGEQAVVWMERAARAALQSGDHDAAARWLTRALHVADTVVPIPSGHRSDIVIARGQAMWRMGNASAARQDFHSVLDAARRSGDGLRLARGALGLAGRFWIEGLRFPTRSTETLAEVVTDALSRLPSAAKAEQALLLAVRACTSASLGDPDAVEEAGEDAVAAAERTEDPRTMGKVLAARAASLCLPHQLPAREIVLARLRSVAAASGDRELAFVAGALAVECHLDRDEPDAAKAELSALDDADGLADDPAIQHRLTKLMTVVAMVDHQWQAAGELARKALEQGRTATDEHDAFLGYMLQMAVLHYNRNDREQLEAIRSTLLTELGGSDRQEGAGAISAWREPTACLFEAWVGDHSSARRRLRRLTADGCRLVPRNQLWLGNLAALVDAADFLEAGEVAQDLKVHFEALEDRRVTVAGLLSLGPVSYYLGMLCRIQGRRDEAEHWLRRAFGLVTRSAVPAHPGPWVMASLSTVLSEHVDASVRAEAGEVAETAERLAVEMGTRGALHRLPPRDRVVS